MNVYRYVLYEYISLLIVVFSATFLFWKELVLFQFVFFLIYCDIFSFWRALKTDSIDNRN